MKAIVINEPFKVEIKDVEDPKMEKATDIIIKVTSGGICGSDLAIYKGTNSFATYPRLIGHEFGGVVQEVGKDVQHVKKGDHVCVDPLIVNSPDSYAVRIGRYNVDPTLNVMGVHRDGGFSEYVSVPASNVYKVDEGIDVKYLSVIEPYTIGYQVNQRAETKAGENVLVIGAGPAGFAVMQIAKARGCRVLMSDTIQSRLDHAMQYGADAVINSVTGDVKEAIAHFTKGEGVPVVVDAACAPMTLALALEYVCAAGRVVCLSTSNKPMPINASFITGKEITLLGSRLTRNGFAPVVKYFEDKVIKPETMVSRFSEFKDAAHIFKNIVEHPEDNFKTVFTFDS